VAWAGATLLACAVPAAAQETIASDRPGIGSASVVLDPGVLQAELGAAWLGGEGPGAVALGQLFVRYGVGRFELELLGNSWVKVREGGPDGFEDPGLGAKVRLAQGIGGRADVSLQGLLTAPAGSDAFTADEWLPALVALADVGLGTSGSMGVNLGYRFGRGPVDGALFASVTPGLSLANDLGAYAGWAGSFAESGDTNWIEGGLAFVASPDLQLDLNAATSPDTDQWFVGVGVAVRTRTR